VLLQEQDIANLQQHLPVREKRRDWQLLYSTARHGISLATAYSKIKDKGPVIFIVEDTSHTLFGAFISESVRQSQYYFGTGESFLFRLHPNFTVYKWSRKNSYFMLANEKSVAFGGGGRGFGLWLDSDFLNGSSYPCDTFDNDTSIATKEDFECLVVEIWGFTGGTS